MNKKASRVDRLEKAISEIARLLEAQGNAINFLLNENAKLKEVNEPEEVKPELDVNAKLDD